MIVTSAEEIDPIQMEASDVNNSNLSSTGQRQWGDIGDVIAIRLRILNKKWSDL